MTGEYLGELRAPLSWQRYPHSVTTRRHIFAMAKKARLALPDPLGGYFAAVLQNRQQPSQALEMVRVYREFFPAHAVAPQPPVPDSEALVSPTLHSRHEATTVPVWNPALAATRRT
jgi:hypothetical protein